MKYKGYIFDLDGVLIDSSKIHYLGWKDVINRLGKDVDYETFRASYFGKRGVDTLEMVFGKGRFSDKEARRLSDEIDSNFVNTVAKAGVPIKGAFEFVRKLDRSGEKVALATSAPRRNADAFLDAFSFRGVFGAEVCGDDVSMGKPDPEVFLKAASRLHVDPSECVVFEDSLPGVKAAKAAGCTCVALLTTSTKEVLNEADFFITDFSDQILRDIIKPEVFRGPKVRERV